MSVKNLFNKRLNNKVVTKTQADNLTNDIESSELVSDVVKSENALIPHVDFSDPKNFSRYGSAEKYYEHCAEYGVEANPEEYAKYINIREIGTVEVKIFGASLDTEEVMHWVETVQKIAKLT